MRRPVTSSERSVLDSSERIVYGSTAFALAMSTHLSAASGFVMSNLMSDILEALADISMAGTQVVQLQYQRTHLGSTALLREFDCRVPKVLALFSNGNRPTPPRKLGSVAPEPTPEANALALFGKGAVSSPSRKLFDADCLHFLHYHMTTIFYCKYGFYK